MTGLCFGACDSGTVAGGCAVDGTQNLHVPSWPLPHSSPLLRPAPISASLAGSMVNGKASTHMNQVQLLLRHNLLNSLTLLEHDNHVGISQSEQKVHYVMLRNKI